MNTTLVVISDKPGKEIVHVCEIGPLNQPGRILSVHTGAEARRMIRDCVTWLSASEQGAA